MREIHYADSSLVTSDEIAAVVMEYAAALANRGEAATLTVPALGLDDGETRVEMLLGPASQVLSTPVHDERVPPGDQGFVEEVRGLIAGLASKQSYQGSWDEF